MSDTYDRRCQLGASRRRSEDAEALHQSQRWLGAVYIGGYTIECSLKALICYQERKENFKDTSVFESMKGASLHNLTLLSSHVPSLHRTIKLDRTNRYREAWKTITSMWKNDELRYSDRQGKQADSEKFLKSIRVWHQELLRKQGESS
jgi:hypothetical protein